MISFDMINWREFLKCMELKLDVCIFFVFVNFEKVKVLFWG